MKTLYTKTALLWVLGFIASPLPVWSAPENYQKVEKLYPISSDTLRNRQSIWEYQFGPLGSKRGFHRSFHHVEGRNTKDIEKRLEKLI